MKPYDKTDLPIEIKYDLEMMKLLVRARELFATYNTILLHQEIEPSFLLRPFLLQEAYKSLELSGAKINQGSLYYLNFDQENEKKHEVINYFNILKNIDHYLTSSFKLSVSYLNNIHKDLFKNPYYKLPDLGKYRSKVTWIGPRGKSIYEADYVPTHPLDIPIAMGNYIKYFNKSYSADRLIDIAISHAQFENIHPYKDGNGRLGRILIPIQAFIETNSYISLYISEAIQNNEYSYYQALKETRNNKWESYTKFFLNLIIEQLTNNINKLEESIKVYKTDSPIVIELLKQKNGKKVYDHLFKNITTTIQDASNSLFIDYQTMRNYMKKLHDKGILAKHKIKKGEYVYTYIKMYNIHVPVEWM